MCLQKKNGREKQTKRTKTNSNTNFTHLHKLLDITQIVYMFFHVLFPDFRALTTDLVVPLPSLKELRLDGNDISMVARNAFNGSRSLETLSLKDNPLSCDCSLKPFAEWLKLSKIAPKVRKYTKNGMQ